MTQILAKIRKRSGTAALWAIANPILADGEEGYESDTKKYKVGNGVDHYNDLSYEPWSLISKEDIASWHDKQDPLSIANEETAGIVVRASNDEALIGDNEEKFVTPKSAKNLIDSAIALLILNAPGALDTLEELAIALGDDPNFATTVSAALAERVKYSDIVNNLGTADSSRVLSALQGKLLKDLIDAIPAYNHRKLYHSHLTEVFGSAISTEEIYAAIPIIGGLVSNGDCIDCTALFTIKSTSSSGKSVFIRAYQNNSLTGITNANIMSTIVSNNSSGNAIPIKLKQDICAKTIESPASTLEASYINSAAGTQGVMTTIANPNVDLSQTWYILFTARKALTADEIILKSAQVFINKA